MTADQAVPVIAAAVILIASTIAVVSMARRISKQKRDRTRQFEAEDRDMEDEAP